MPQLPEYKLHCPNCDLLNPEDTVTCGHCKHVYSQKEIKLLKESLKLEKQVNWIVGSIVSLALLLFFYFVAEYLGLKAFFWD